MFLLFKFAFGAVFEPAEKGRIAGVGQPEGIDLIDEHALLAPREEEAHAGDEDERQEQSPAALDGLFHIGPPYSLTKIL